MSDVDINQMKILLMWEQDNLWSDLTTALRFAANGYWSVEAGWKVERIINIAEVVGLTPWGRVSIPLLTSGIYSHVARKMGLETDLDIDQIKRDHPDHAGFPPLWELTGNCIDEMYVDKAEIDE